MATLAVFCKQNNKRVYIFNMVFVAENKLHPLSVRVDVRKLSNFMTCEQISPDHVLCHIRDESNLNIRVEHNDVILNFFLPSVDE